MVAEEGLLDKATNRAHYVIAQSVKWTKGLPRQKVKRKIQSSASYKIAWYLGRVHLSTDMLST